MKRIRVPAVALLFCLAALPAAAAAPKSPYFDFVLDEGVFTLYAAMNAHGYDQVSNYMGMAPVRVQVRDAIEAMTDVHEPLHRFTDVIHEIGHSEHPAVWYVLHSDGPPDFGVGGMDTFSRETQRLMPLWEEAAPPLAEFYSKGDIHRLWEDVKPEYARAVASLAPEADAIAASALETVGIRSATAIPAKVTVIPNLISAYWSGHRIDIEGRPTVVLGPQVDPDPGIPVRALLESVIREALKDRALEIREKGDLYETVRDMPRIKTATRNFPDLVTECMVWVAWVRASGEDRRWAEGELDRLYADGFILVRVFNAEMNLGKYRSPYEMMGRMLNAVEVKREQGRWKESEWERRNWTDVAQADLDRRQGRMSDAQMLYEGVLERDPGQGRALYGFGSLLFSQENFGEAKSTLEKAVHADPDEKWVTTWSWIRIGWIEDLAGRREAALNAYKRAIDTGDNYLNALAVARQGLEKPYEGK